MSTAAEVESAWETAIWKSNTIKAITPNYFLYAVTEDSEKEISRMYLDSHINSIQALTGRGFTFGNTKTGQYTFVVEVTYLLWKDPDGDNWTQVRDFYDTLLALIRSALGNTWSSTVDFWTPQSAPASIDEFTIDGETVWRGKCVYTGTQSISLT